jgi:hypothetical protein
MDLAGGFFAEPLLAVLFAGSVVAWAAAARAFSSRAAIVVAIAVLVYPAYALMFHELSSEPVFAAAFALWAFLVTRAAVRPSARSFAYAGLANALLALARPGNALLLAFVLFPLAYQGSWRKRAQWAAAFLAAGVLPLTAWAVLNGIRFGDYALARGGNAVIPFYRAFITDRIVSPDNGPASRKLARAIRTDLLTRNPYKGYGVTLHEVFASGSFRIHEDLYLLSDQVFGWNSNYSVLRKAGIEAVRAHPGTYASGVGDTIWEQLSKSYFRTLPTQTTTKSAGSRTTASRTQRPPPPSEGQPIPAGQNVWISRPDNSIRDVWTSPTRHHFVFLKPSQRPGFEHIIRRRNALFRNLPHRSANAELTLRLNQASRWYPRMIVWIVLGAMALVVRRPRRGAVALAIALAALFVIVFNALGLFADPRFALPVAPAFVLFAAAAAFAPRGVRDRFRVAASR